MKIFLELFTRLLDNCKGSNENICNEISIGGKLAGRTDQDTELELVKAGGFLLAEAAWKIETFPTLIFAVQGPQQNDLIGIAKLVGRQINSRNIEKMFGAISKLQPTGNGTFYNPEEPTFIQIGLSENNEDAPGGGSLLAVSSFNEITLDFDKGKWWKNPLNWLIIGAAFYGYKKLKSI